MQIDPINLKEIAAILNASFIGDEHHLITYTRNHLRHLIS